MNGTVRVMLTLVLATVVAHAAWAAGDPAAGEKKSTPCQACHGKDGNGTSPIFPRLAGQHADYIVHALEAYKDGTRQNPIMAPQAAKLTEQDREDLAAYFSSLKGLHTLPHH